MGSMGEHINGLYFGHFVFSVQFLQVAGLGCWVATDVDDTLWSSIEYRLHHIGVHASTGRVGDDDVGPAVFCYEIVGQDVFHVAGKEQRIVYAVQL